MEQLAKEHILHLIEFGVMITHQMGTTLGFDVQADTKLAREAVAYLDAANALLNGFPTLYNELIEHKNFITLRVVKRNYKVGM